MKLSEIKGERALEVLADIIDPIGEIGEDEEFMTLLTKEKDYKAALKCILKKHSKSTLTIIALLNEEDVETYQPSLLELPAMVMDLLQDKDFLSLFISQEQSTEQTSSGPATENTEANEQ